MTTSVAMTAQYASGIPTSRASNTENVAATAVRTACHTDGRFSSFQLHSFISAIISGAGCTWQACASAMKKAHRVPQASDSLGPGWPSTEAIMGVLRLQLNQTTPRCGCDSFSAAHHIEFAEDTLDVRLHRAFADE